MWLCADARGHDQATGRDAKGRKQYRYHADWQTDRNDAKFEMLADFGHALPRLRRRVADDIRRRDLSPERVVATTVWLLDRTLIRVGNSEYSADSCGLTTLLDEHVEIEADTLHFRFIGKGGKPHDVALSDRRVARIVAKCQELPGQQLLQYLDGDEVRGVGSRDANDYIREVTRTGFTAKTFRTWGGSASTLRALRSIGPASTPSEAAAQVRDAVRATADRLRNTSPCAVRVTSTPQCSTPISTDRCTSSARARRETVSSTATRRTSSRCSISDSEPPSRSSPGSTVWPAGGRGIGVRSRTHGSCRVESQGAHPK